MVTEREAYNRQVDVLLGNQIVAEHLNSSISLERDTSAGTVKWRGEVVFAGSDASRCPLGDSFTIRCDDGRSGQTQVTRRAIEKSSDGSLSRVIVYFDGVGDPPFGIQVVELHGEQPAPRGSIGNPRPALHGEQPPPRGSIGGPEPVRKDVTIQAPPATAQANAEPADVQAEDLDRGVSTAQLSVIQLLDAVEHLDDVQRIVRDISNEATPFERVLLEGVAIQVDLLSEYIEGRLEPVGSGEPTVPWSTVRALEVLARRLLELLERPEAIQLGGALLELIEPFLKLVGLD